MDNYNREKQRNSYIIMRRIYDFTIAILILGMAVVMLFAEQIHLDKVIDLDETLRWLFGIMCLLYGGFRIYRAVKSEY